MPTERLKLSFASAVNERVRPLVDGAVRPDGIDLISTATHASETFWRELRFGDFDVCEMSLSSLLIAKSNGSDLVAIPAFPSRRFFQIEIDRHADAGIGGPQDLVGKRVGVPEYQQTAALWLREILAHDFGVDPKSVRWYMEREARLSHGGAEFRPPAGISLERISPDKSLASMLMARELDAAFCRPNRGGALGNVIERSQGSLQTMDWSKLAPVFPDPIAEGKRFFDAHGYIPINHTYVLKGDLFRRHPWIALNLYKAFIEAKRLAERSLIDAIPMSLVFRWEYLAQTRALFGDDPFPYGFEANRRALEDLAHASHEQGLIASALDVSTIFAPSTMEWS